MPEQDYKEKTLEQLVSELISKGSNVVTYEDLKTFAVDKINCDDLNTAIHVLKAMQEDEANFYIYDYSMGTLETPSAVKEIEDIAHLLD